MVKVCSIHGKFGNPKCPECWAKFYALLDEAEKQGIKVNLVTDEKTGGNYA